MPFRFPAALFPLALPILAPFAFAQSATDLNQGLSLQLIPSTPGAYEARWWGGAGRTYFLERSTDLAAPWEYFPVIETGHDAAIAYGFFTESPRVFIRVRYIEQTYDNPYDLDLDGDGLSNQQEFLRHGNPFLSDTDGDGIPDGVESALLRFLPGGDWEYLRLNQADSDGNGVPDGLEDYDGDGLTTFQELSLGTSPNKRDSDTDGVDDGKELAIGTNPLVNDHFADLDSDNDGLSDLLEILHGSDPHNADTNGNGMPDGLENNLGGDPARPGDPPEIPPPDLPAPATTCLRRWCPIASPR